MNTPQSVLSLPLIKSARPTLTERMFMTAAIVRTNPYEARNDNLIDESFPIAEIPFREQTELYFPDTHHSLSVSEYASPVKSVVELNNSYLRDNLVSELYGRWVLKTMSASM